MEQAQCGNDVLVFGDGGSTSPKTILLAMYFAYSSLFTTFSILHLEDEERLRVSQLYPHSSTKLRPSSAWSFTWQGPRRFSDFKWTENATHILDEVPS